MSEKDKHLLTGIVVEIDSATTDQYGAAIKKINFKTTVKLGRAVPKHESESVWFHFPQNIDIKIGDLVIIRGEVRG